MSITKHIRSKDWLNSFIPLIMGILYYWIFYYKLDLSWALAFVIFFFLLSSLGFAALGYLINDFFDQKDDYKSNKKNSLESLPSVKIAILILSAFFLAVLPWGFIPYNSTTIILLSSQMISYLLYNSPPFRFKRYPLLSNIIDLFYAYIIPFLLIFNTITLFAKQNFSFDVNFFLMLALLFVTGFLNIVIHQKNDIPFDRKTNIKSLPIYLGKQKTTRLIYLNFIIQLIVLTSFLALLISIDRVFTILLGILLIQLLFAKIDKKFFAHSNILLVNKFLQVYFPLTLLCILSITNAYYLIFLLAHIIFFISKESRRSLLVPMESYYKFKYFAYEITYCKYLRPSISAFSNQLVYQTFLLFKVDLKEKQINAKEYIKLKLNKRA